MTRPATTPATPRKKDPRLEEALGATRAQVRRLGRGQVVLVIDAADGWALSYSLREWSMTEEDYDRLMRERPWPRGAKEGRDR